MYSCTYRGSVVTKAVLGSGLHNTSVEGSAFHIKTVQGSGLHYTTVVMESKCK